MSRSSVASRLSSAASSPFLAAIREALPWSFIALIAAGLCILPIARSIPGAMIPAFGVMGAALAPALGWFYARRAGVNPVAMIAGTTLAFLVSMPPYAGAPLAYLRAVGPSGLLVAFAACGLCAFIAFAVRNVWIGALAGIVIAVVLRFDHVSVTLAFSQALAPLARLGDTYAALMIIVLVQTLLWTIGVHGPALLAAVVTPIYLALQMQNTQAYAHHLALPHIVVVSLFLFVFPGGAGSTLPLAGLLALSRVSRLRTVGRATIVPALFNANEPLLFALPVVLNPFLVPPFLIAPLVLATITYVTVQLGLVGRAIYYVPSSIPTPVSTYLATLDPRAILLVAVNLGIAAAIYLPFVRAYERHLDKEMQAAA
jgi:lactose/cellobiose-specific phosphotransferase system IIC component